MSPSPPVTTQGAAERLDRLPLGRFHRRFIVLVSLGCWFDVFDIFMMAYLGAALQSSHFLTLAQFTNLIAAGFLGMFAGTIVLGAGSDSFGRRPAFILMLGRTRAEPARFAGRASAGRRRNRRGDGGN